MIRIHYRMDYRIDYRIDYTLPCIEHDRLPFSVVFYAPRVFSVPQLMFSLIALALRILKSGQAYL